MTSPIRPLGLVALMIALPSCGVDGTGSSSLASNHPTGTGPFCSSGNYIEDWADSPANWIRPSAVAVSAPATVRPAAARPVVSADPPAIARHEQPPMHSVPIVASAPPPPRPAAPAAAPKPKPKPVVVSAPKPPAQVRYTIKRGDTLTAIASRHKTSVAALQRANNIKGSLIHPGKVLVIPRS